MNREEQLPLVSVVIPTYNRRQLLTRAVDSAKAQTGVRTEIIVCDDGSTDGTAADWQCGPDIVCLVLPHRGACAARNAGILRAAGEWIAFLDSDDTWQPEKLKMQLELLKRTGADAVCCSFTRHGCDGSAEAVPGSSVPEGWVSKDRLLEGNFVSTQTILGRTECFRGIMFDVGLPRLQDWDFAIRLADAGRLYYVPQPLADVWLQRDSISMKPELGIVSLGRIYEKNRTAYGHSVRAALAWQRHVYYFAVQSGESVWKSCRPARENAAHPADRIRLKGQAAMLVGKQMIKGLRGMRLNKRQDKAEAGR